MGSTHGFWVSSRRKRLFCAARKHGYKAITATLAVLTMGTLGCSETSGRALGPLGLAPDDDLIRDIDDESDLRTATVKLPGAGEVEVLYRVVDGRGFWTGDILLGDVDDIESGFRAASIVSNLWPNKTVRYRWADGIDGGAKSVLQSAMNTWEASTSIRFVEDTDSAGGYALFTSKDGAGCISDVGHRGPGAVGELNLGSGCHKKWVALHELGHLMGLWHEQSREDRDSHIDIDWDNIQDGFAAELDKYSKTSAGKDRGAYDFDSVMHYGSYAYAKDENKPVITKKNGDTIEQSTVLSAGDISAIEAMYAGGGGPGGDDDDDDGADGDDGNDGGDGDDGKPGDGDDGGGADKKDSCAGSCGSSNPIATSGGGECYCDASCVEYGDCCGDREEQCGGGDEDEPAPAGTCQNMCDKAVPDGNGGQCYCDSLCTDNGDCCSDYAQACGQSPGDGGEDDGGDDDGGDDGGGDDGGTPSPAGSCVDQCGGQSGTCYCDETCEEYGDCCGDYHGACG